MVGSTRVPRRDPRKGSGEYDSVVGTCRRRRAPEPPPVPALRAGASLKDMPHPHASTDDPGGFPGMSESTRLTRGIKIMRGRVQVITSSPRPGDVIGRLMTPNGDYECNIKIM